jgi:hypothetical protein
MAGEVNSSSARKDKVEVFGIKRIVYFHREPIDPWDSSV